MKKYIKYLWLMVLSVVSFGCEDFYKTTLSQDVTIDEIFSTEVMARSYLNEAYWGIQHRFPINSADYAINGAYVKKAAYLQQGTIDALGDEAMSGRTTHGFTLYVDDGVEASGWNNSANTVKIENYFNGFYYYLNACDTYINNVGAVKNASTDFVSQTVAEAKLLKAFMYVEMMKRYGSLPLFDPNLTSGDDFVITRPALADYVAAVDLLITEAIVDLPASYSSSADLGKMTKGVGYFLRSRLWLLAASPLFNKRGDADYATLEENSGGSHRGLDYLNYSDSYDSSLWTKAAEVTKAAIDYCDANYSLVKTSTGSYTDATSWEAAWDDYYTATYMLTGAKGNTNTECVFFTRWRSAPCTLTNSWFHRRALPTGRELAGAAQAPKDQSTTSPVQSHINKYRLRTTSKKLVDDPLDVLNPELQKFYADTANPWEDYELRFHVSTYYDNLTIPVTGFTDFVYQSYREGDAYWQSGYSMRKFMPDNFLKVTSQDDVSTDLLDINMRLPELYMHYAEILVELNRLSEVFQWLKPTMERALLDTTVIEAEFNALDQDGARDFVRNEKAVEFAYEGLRYWDTKRWLEGDLIANRKYGVYYDNADGYASYWDSTDGDYPGNQDGVGYVIVPVGDTWQYMSPNYYFPARQYLWPIPSEEVLKNYGFETCQNPGY